MRAPRAAPAGRAARRPIGTSQRSGPKGSDAVIEQYDEREATLEPWDPRAQLVAARVAALVEAALPCARVEHIGSTSVPGLAGKGVVDLMLLYPPGGLVAARDALAALGFQPQSNRDPWPEERPMRVGALRHDGVLFRLHVHVLAADSSEVAELRAFRDALRADPPLRAAYVARKQAVLAAGLTDSVDYSLAKGGFIEGWLGRAGGVPEVAG